MFRKEMKIKLGFIFVVIALCLVALWPTFRYYRLKKTGEWKKLSREEQKVKKEYIVNLGLDLQGGMDLVIKVDLDKIREMGMEKVQEKLMEELTAVGVTDFSIVPGDTENMTLKVGEIGDEGYRKLVDVFNNIGTLEITRPTGGIILGAKEIELFFKYDVAMSDAVERALEVIRNRIDEIGVMEPSIKRIGDNLIRIQLPGVADPDQARKILGQTAMLEFKLVKEVRDAHTPPEELKQGEEELMGRQVDDPKTGKKRIFYYILEKKTLLTGDTLEDARVAFDNMNNPYVRLEFNALGGREFEKITGANVNRNLAIVLDGKVQTAPVIKQKIRGGSAVIENIQSLEDAKHTAIVLRTGALPAPVSFEEERTVGPSLGRDSIIMGRNAVLIGLVLVLFFMLFFYKFLGILAVMALVMNMLIVLGVMVALHATLTLPGIAGLILLVGIAVDANVIIFERIKEELKQGKTLRASIDAGFRKALSAIVDANVTTIITAFVLMYLGTGPVRGFAVTLIIGIFASMFTALFVVKVVAHAIVQWRGWKTLNL